MDENKTKEIEQKGEEIVAKLKDMVKEGNVTRIRIRKADTTILNIPMTAGVLGTVLGAAVAPWALILAAIATIGLECTVEVEKKDGQVTVVYGKDKL